MIEHTRTPQDLCTCGMPWPCGMAIAQPAGCNSEDNGSPGPALIDPDVMTRLMLIDEVKRLRAALKDIAAQDHLGYAYYAVGMAEAALEPMWTERQRKLLEFVASLPPEDVVPDWQPSTIEEKIVKMQERHVKDANHPWCRECGMDLPCDALYLIDEMELLRQKVQELDQPWTELLKARALLPGTVTIDINPEDAEYMAEDEWADDRLRRIADACREALEADRD